MFFNFDTVTYETHACYFLFQILPYANQVYSFQR
jgi:hypothetical protein